MTAENSAIFRTTASGTWGFNEAAADDRGKHARARRRAPPVGGFNEAAADDRGKLLGAPATWAVAVASMRPRPMTAENWIVSCRVPRSGPLQ